MKFQDFIPPIFLKRNLFKYYYYKFFSKSFYTGTYFFKRPKFDRRALINSIVFKKCKNLNVNEINYLEIGCDKNGTFNSICLPLKNKIGVDPVSGGTIRTTSDEFFVNNNQKFDIIFIDGLHTYQQVKKDFQNSLNCLKDQGYIFVDDMLPYNWGMQHNPRIQSKWTGDVWKLAIEIIDSNIINYNFIETNYGIGVFYNYKNNLKLPNRDYSMKKFQEYIDYRNRKIDIYSAEKFIIDNLK